MLYCFSRILQIKKLTTCTLSGVAAAVPDAATSSINRDESSFSKCCCCCCCCCFWVDLKTNSLYPFQTVRRTWKKTFFWEGKMRWVTQGRWWVTQRSLERKERALLFGIHTDIPGRTQQPELFSFGFTQISLGAHNNPSTSLWDSHRYPWAHRVTRAFLFGIHTDIPGHTQQPELFSLGFTQISQGTHNNPSTSPWDSHKYPWANTEIL